MNEEEEKKEHVEEYENNIMSERMKKFLEKNNAKSIAGLLNERKKSDGNK